MSNLPVRLRYTLDEDTFLQATRAMWWLGRRQRKVRIRGWLFAAALPVAGWLAVQHGMVVTLLAVIGINLVHWVFDWPIARAMSRRQFPHLPAAGKTLCWEIDETGFQLRVDNEPPARITWKMLIDIIETPEGFILAQPHNVHHWLPRAAFFPDSIEPFLALLNEHHPRGRS